MASLIPLALAAAVYPTLLAGVIVLLARDKPEGKKGPSWTQRTLGEGSAWAAFGAGLLLNVPGVWYLDGLKDIAKANEGTVATILYVLLFVVIMFALAELPLIGYSVDPDGTRVRVQRFQTWLGRHAMVVASGVAGVLGVYLVLKGIVGLG